MMLVMHRKAIAEGLINRLRDNSEVQLIYETHYENANFAAELYKLKLVLIEAAESDVHDTTYCLKLCKQIRRRTPECKLLLMCSEQDETSVEQVVDAKKKSKLTILYFMM